MSDNFDKVALLDVIEGCQVAMGEIEQAQTILAAIETLAGEDRPTIGELAAIARGIMDGTHNDLDVLRGRAAENLIAVAEARETT